MVIDLSIKPIPLDNARRLLDDLDTKIIDLVAQRLRQPQRNSTFLQYRISELVSQGTDPKFAETYYRLLTEQGLMAQFETSKSPTTLPVEIDLIDRQLLSCLVERMQISIALTKTKLHENIAIVHPEREAAVLQSRADKAQALGIDPNFMKQLFRLLMDEGVRIQRQVWQNAPYGHRVLTGVRPTGPLHLGHYVGTLKSWIELQKIYECFFLIADYQALGSHASNPELIRDSVLQVTLDWLAIGLDPNNASFLVQSYVPQHAELTMLLSMIIPWTRHIGNPTLKAEMDSQAAGKELLSLGFVMYPGSQVADILLMKGDVVPVGEDQIPHIEETRRVAREFNKRYGQGRTILPIPQIRLSDNPRLVGLDGTSKMSKSRRNTIDLRDDPETVRSAVNRMFTDPGHLKPSDPGKVQDNVVFTYLTTFGNPEEVDDLKAQYTKGGLSDKATKDRLAEILNELLAPIRDRRAYFEARPELVRDALMAGSDRARVIAEETMREVRDAMRITHYAEF